MDVAQSGEAKSLGDVSIQQLLDFSEQVSGIGSNIQVVATSHTSEVNGATQQAVNLHWPVSAI